MLEITEYSLGPSCQYCTAMKRAYLKWKEHNPREHKLTTLSAAEHRDMLKELGAMSAPVWVVKDENNEYVVSGLNTDALVDILDGDGDFWVEAAQEEE